jgi:hypothetical protein
MERISQVLDNLKDRLSSPLVFSFIASWLVINWEITVSLVWYDPPVNAKGHNYLIESIRSHLNFCDSFVWPALFALAYTILAPLAKLLVSAFQTLVDKKSQNLNLKISEGTNIPLDKYLALDQTLQQRSDHLAKLIKEQNDNVKRVDTYRKRNEEYKEKEKRMEDELRRLRSVHDNLYDQSIMKGDWVCESIGDNGIRNKTIIQFQGNSIFYQDGTGKSQSHNISHFIFDSIGKRLYFITTGVKGGEYSFNDFTLHANDMISGWEFRDNQRYQIKLTRPDFDSKNEVSKP